MSILRGTSRDGNHIEIGGGYPCSTMAPPNHSRLGFHYHQPPHGMAACISSQRATIAPTQRPKIFFGNCVLNFRVSVPSRPNQVIFLSGIMKSFIGVVGRHLERRSLVSALRSSCKERMYPPSVNHYSTHLTSRPSRHVSS